MASTDESLAKDHRSGAVPPAQRRGTALKSHTDIVRPAHVALWERVAIITESGERVVGHFEPTIPVVNRWNA